MEPLSSRIDTRRDRQDKEITKRSSGREKTAPQSLDVMRGDGYKEMWDMKTRALNIVAGCVAAVLVISVFGCNGNAKLPATGGCTFNSKLSRLSPELKILHKFVGNWQGSTTEWTPERFSGPLTTSCRSILGGQFTLTKVMASNGNGYISVSTYDGTFRGYRKWRFGWRGLGQEAEGTWDDKTRTMTWRSDLGHGETSVETVRYLEDKTVKWSVITRYDSGNIPLQMAGKYARVKQPPKPKNKPMELSAEDKVLDMFLGDWKIVSTTPENSLNILAGTWTSTSSCVRAFGGPFLLETTKDSDGETTLNIKTYDVWKECYREWWFTPEGYSGEDTFMWDAKTRTLIARRTTHFVGNGITVYKLQRVDNDTLVWRTVIMHLDGNTTVQSHGKCTRIKKPAKKKYTAPQHRDDPHHIVYLIDRSGSMFDIFDAVKDEIVKSVKELHPAQDFHVIMFADGQPLEKMPKALTPPTDKNKIALAKFLMKAKAKGTTDPVKGINRAFDVLDKADKRPGKIIYLLADGGFPDNKAVIAAIRARNARKDVAIHTFLCGKKSPVAVKVMSQIAEENGGRYRYIDLAE